MTAVENEPAGRPFANFIAEAATEPMRTAVVHPVDEKSLGAARAAHEAGLIEPILIGPKLKIQTAADKYEIDLTGIELVETPHSHAAAEKAVALVRDKQAHAIMKGALHTNELMAEIVSKQTGLRTERRMSHVFLMETPAYSKRLIISDGALNILPDLATKRWIVQNAIDAARAVGTKTPKTAILSATEEVDPNIPSTIDAAALCKMADRGQIVGGIIDGPLAFDLAVSTDAVRTKGLVSKVAGSADILIVPTLEAGNMLAKQLDYLAGGTAAGIVMGASAPIILTSRADGINERVASCAFACRVAAWQKAQRP